MTFRAPFMPSWHGEEPGPTPAELDAFFGPCAVTMNTYQLAIQAILESMGSRMYPIPVILPVTSSPQTLAGVLRSGSQPVLLDIEKDTLQMQPELVRQILGELPDGAVVILNRPNGMLVDRELYVACSGFPTIEDTRLIPHPKADVDIATFSVFDLSVVVGDGAVVFHQHADQLAAIKHVRNGIMGCSGTIVDRAAAFVKGQCQTPLVDSFWSQQRCALSEYTEKLPEYADCGTILQNRSHFPQYVLCKSENAAADIADLRRHGVEAKYGVFGLHNLPEIKERYMDMPEYPVADEVMRTTIALPLNNTEYVIPVYKQMREET